MDEPVGFLVSDVARLMRKRFDERARALGVTRAQWQTLLKLSRNEGINQGGLADLLEIEPITLCRMIDRLEEAGLVERRRDPADRRAWRIHLAQRAHPIIDQLRELADGVYEQAFAGIGGDDQARVAQLLTRMRANLGSAADQPTKDAAHG